MKQFVSKLVALGMAVTLFASATGAFSASAATSMCGDVNCDGSISMADVVLLNKYCSGECILENYANADTNENGIIDTVDSQIISAFLLGMIGSIPYTN